VQPLQTLRAFVPVSVADPEAPSPPRVSGLLVDLPVGEADPQRRLRLTSQATAAHRSSGRAVHAQVLVSLGGFAPPTLHALGSRAASGLARRMFQLVVTNVPGPQQPLYAAGARLLEMFPILPLTPGHAVSIGLTSYAGGVYYGVNGDRDAIPDLAALAAHIEDAIDELVEVSSPDGRPPEPVSLTTARPAAPGDRAEPSGDPA
jgi:WS/DGAT/MGAT family acyltransferase